MAPSATRIAAAARISASFGVTVGGPVSTVAYPPPGNSATEAASLSCAAWSGIRPVAITKPSGTVSSPRAATAAGDR